MTILESYREYKQGKINKAQFMERARKDVLLKKFVTNVMSFDDTVRVLKNKGILSESLNAPRLTAAQMWSNVEDEERYDLILSQVKDPDEAEKYWDMPWDRIPDPIAANIARELESRWNDEDEDEGGIEDDPEERHWRGHTSWQERNAPFDSDDEYLDETTPKNSIEEGYGEFDMEDDSPDYNSISDLESELNRLVRWSNQYGSSGAEAKINQLRKRIEYLKSQSMKGGKNLDETVPENNLPGGKGDKLRPEDVDGDELHKGMAVEMEHTNDVELAQEIALDHLAEDPHYYTNLFNAGMADELSEDGSSDWATLEQVDQDYDFYSDLYKEKMGFRPRYMSNEALVDWLNDNFTLQGNNIVAKEEEPEVPSPSPADSYDSTDFGPEYDEGSDRDNWEDEQVFRDQEDLYEKKKIDEGLFSNISKALGLDCVRQFNKEKASIGEDKAYANFVNCMESKGGVSKSGTDRGASAAGGNWGKFGRTTGEFKETKKLKLKEGVEIIPAEVRKGVNYELDLCHNPIPDWDQPFVSEEEVEKVTKRVLKNLQKDPLYYTKLIGTGEKPVKEGDSSVKEFKKNTVSDTTNKTTGDGNLKKVVKKDEKANVSASKKENKKGKPKGVTVLKDKGVEGSEKIIKESLHEDWGSSDQSIMNKSIHRTLGEPEDMPMPFDKEFEHAVAEAVDFYWDDWNEYRSDRDGLIANAKKRYYRAYFPEKFQGFVEMFSEGSTPGSLQGFTVTYKNYPLEKESTGIVIRDLGDKVIIFNKRDGLNQTISKDKIISTSKPNQDNNVEEEFRPGVDLGNSFDKMKTDPKEKFENLMKNYDWYYEMSDDHGVWERGVAVDKELKQLAKQFDPEEALLIWNRYAPKDRKRQNTNFFTNENTDKMKEEYTGEFDKFAKTKTSKKDQYLGAFGSAPTPKGETFTHNSIEQVIQYLKKNPGKSENEILQDVWGYDRKNSFMANKKFADLIRRGLKAGKIARVKKINPVGKTKFYYYVPTDPANITPTATSPAPIAEKTIKYKGSKDQLKEQIKKKMYEAIMYKIGKKNDDTVYSRKDDRDLEDKLKKAGVSYTKKDIQEKQPVREYFVNDKSTVRDVEALNLFYDTSIDSENPINPQLVKKYSPIAAKLSAQLKPYLNKPLPEKAIKLIDDTWYDGSDAYDDDMQLEHLPEIYNAQIKAVKVLIQLLKNR